MKSLSKTNTFISSDTFILFHVFDHIIKLGKRMIIPVNV
jgi:hypothetical protein